MPASLNDHLETYKQARTAYAQQNYEVAARLVDQVVQNVPDDPNCHLLRGHVYYVLQQYHVAQEEYKKVLQLSDDPEIIGFANDGLENINQYQEPQESNIEPAPAAENQQQEPGNFVETDNHLQSVNPELENLALFDNLDNNSWELSSINGLDESVNIEELSLTNPFEVPIDSISLDENPDFIKPSSEDPFAWNQTQSEQESDGNTDNGQIELELPLFWEEKIDPASPDEPEIDHDESQQTTLTYNTNHNIVKQAIAEVNFAEGDNIRAYQPEQEQNMANFAGEESNQEYKDLLVTGENPENASSLTNLSDNSPGSESSNWSDKIQVQENLTTPSPSLDNLSAPQPQEIPSDENLDINHFGNDDDFDLETFKAAFGDEDTNHKPNEDNHHTNVEFLDDFDEFDDLANISGFDVEETSASFNDVSMISGSLNSSGQLQSSHKYHQETSDSETLLFRGLTTEENNSEDELFSITDSQNSPFTATDLSDLEPKVGIEQGWLAPLENAPLDVKPWFVAGTVGIFSALVVAAVSFTATNFSPAEQRESVRNTGWAMSLAAGIAGFGTAAFMGSITLKQIRRTTEDLEAQFEAVRQGNFNVEATVYSQDELGRLATGFNEMAQAVLTTTHQAQRKANEQEEAKENLQRQVIRLLDDVEGAARGDLTVQAEVTADVLGAVADAFNLTIQNLRDIVQQVTVAAKEVTKGATNSETFARALSSDALRQAEELKVTLNSVQVMTDCIKRIAEAAREAEIVAGDASAIAVKGGEAVENTVAGILEIRETVAETTRKVKRLAESSQEISKIVALISQIASRTNLLALNASIEAARAGEAGRGFAIVADEVRQLADKSAKSLKEIEQIVLQIQSETGSVMTAMEEGTQQVIKGTKLAEEAKRSLDNIIQVANRIDTLVRSITSDTVEQTETSRSVAQVMQSVELTAQETSQEAQRVSGALQFLVGVSRDLISSVERFRVETPESK